MLIAATSIYLLAGAARLISKDRIVRLTLSASVAAFVYLFGTWVFLSIYSRYIFGITYVFLFVFTLFRIKKTSGDRKMSKAGFVSSAMLSLVFIVLCILYFTGTTRKHQSIDLAFPMKKGTYFVFQGGRGLPANLMHSIGRHTSFAMDIIKLNNFGNRANAIFSKDNSDYCIFSDTIYSPCSGVIAKTEDTNPDNIPPDRKRGPKNLNGVVIETRDAFIFLGHMKYKSVFVHAGQTIRQGEPLGLAGNSGSSLEPHVHIQAHAKTNNSLPWYNQPQLEILFGGKWYNLFDVIRADE